MACVQVVGAFILKAYVCHFLLNSARYLAGAVISTKAVQIPLCLFFIDGD